MRETNETMTAAERLVLDEVAEHGVHIVHVDEDDDAPCYSYTVGMPHSFEQPEVIVFGLPREIAADLLDAVADEAADGAAFAADGQRDGLLHGYPVKFVAVPRTCYREYLATAVWAHESEDFACLQVVWPDKQGRWPWSAGVRDGFAELQPVLGRREAGA